MKSNICKIEKGTLDLEAILKESEKVATYNELNEKQKLQLRLICEELDGMLPNIVDEFYGDFWIDFEEGICKINVLIEFDEFTADKKKELIKLAKNKKNAQAKGLLGKIRSALEDLFLGRDGNRAYDLAWQFNYANEYCVGMDYSYMWSLKQYKNDAPEEEKQEYINSYKNSRNAIIGLCGASDAYKYIDGKFVFDSKQKRGRKICLFFYAISKTNKMILFVNSFSFVALVRRSRCARWAMFDGFGASQNGGVQTTRQTRYFAKQGFLYGYAVPRCLTVLGLPKTAVSSRRGKLDGRVATSCGPKLFREAASL